MLNDQKPKNQKPKIKNQKKTKIKKQETKNQKPKTKNQKNKKTKKTKKNNENNTERGEGRPRRTKNGVAPMFADKKQWNLTRGKNI